MNTIKLKGLRISIYLRWKFCTLTFLYGAVFRWHHNSSPSLAVISAHKQFITNEMHKTKPQNKLNFN